MNWVRCWCLGRDGHGRIRNPLLRLLPIILFLEFFLFIVIVIFDTFIDISLELSAYQVGELLQIELESLCLPVDAVFNNIIDTDQLFSR